LIPTQPDTACNFLHFRLDIFPEMGYHETAIPAKITKREVSIMPQAFEKAVWIWRNAPAGRDEFCDFLTTFTAGADTACVLPRIPITPCG
jgi:hypothetical protein